MKRLRNSFYRNAEDPAKEEAEKKRLSKMTVDELRVELETQLKARLIDEIQLMPTLVRNKVSDLSDQLLAALLGLRKDTFSSKFEIDNNSKNSALASQIGEQVVADLQLATPDFFASLAPAGDFHKKVKTAYGAAYQRAYTDLLHKKIEDAATEGASKRLTEVLNEVQKSFDSAVSSQKEKEDE